MTNTVTLSELLKKIPGYHSMHTCCKKSHTAKAGRSDAQSALIAICLRRVTSWLDCPPGSLDPQVRVSTSDKNVRFFAIRQTVEDDSRRSFVNLSQTTLMESRHISTAAAAMSVVADAKTQKNSTSWRQHDAVSASIARCKICRRSVRWICQAVACAEE